MLERATRYGRDIWQLTTKPRLRTILLLVAGRPIVEMTSWREICADARSSAMRAQSTIDRLDLSDAERSEIARVVRMAVFKAKRWRITRDRIIKDVQDSACLTGAVFLLLPIFVTVAVLIPGGTPQSVVEKLESILVGLTFPFVLALYRLPSALKWTGALQAAWRFAYWAIAIGAIFAAAQNRGYTADLLFVYAGLILLTRIFLSLFTLYEDLSIAHGSRAAVTQSADLFIIINLVNALGKLQRMANPVRDRQLRLDLIWDMDQVVRLTTRYLRIQLKTKDMAANLEVHRTINRMIAAIRLLKSRMAVPIRHYRETLLPQLTDVLRHACRGEWAAIETDQRPAHSLLDALQWSKNAGKRMAPALILLLFLFAIGQIRGIEDTPLLKQALVFAGIYAIISLLLAIDPDFLSQASSIADVMSKLPVLPRKQSEDNDENKL